VIPYKLENISLKRYGVDGDGGYILSPELLKDIDVIYCYGVMEEDIISCSLAKALDVMVYQYDCFSKNTPTCSDTKNQKFIRECAGKQYETRGEEGYVFNTVENHVTQNNDNDKKILMLMDIEGSEYEVIINMPVKILKQIVQLQLEIHWFFDDQRGGVGSNGSGATKRILKERPSPQYFKKLIKKMLMTHYIAHVHCNNFTCADNPHGPKSYYNIPCDVIEILFINKNYTKKTSEKLTLPLIIDQPNQPAWKDCSWTFD